MPTGYDVRAGGTSDVQSTAADNTTTQTVTPPNQANGVLISVLTADVWVTFGAGTPSASLGHVFKKDAQPWFGPFAKTFKWKVASASAATVNITWLY